MGALPKQRVSNGRQGRRRSHHRVELPQIVTCQHCKQKKVAHHICPNCGYYHGREIGARVPGFKRVRATAE
jgi:large subunit ribosomal protein L32